ncbi:MAG: hypothetical protein KGI80_04560 [Verrucomicrobiota bacterium]|nr:hypothetical protein [Verrucomicrobiota bacterium]
MSIISGSNSPTNFYLKWPDDLIFTEADTVENVNRTKYHINMVLTSLIQKTRGIYQYQIEYKKEGTKYSRLRTISLYQLIPNRNNIQKEFLRIKTESHAVPFSFLFENNKDGVITRIILITKKTIANTAKVRLCYDLISGEKLVRKLCPNRASFFVHERAFIEQLTRTPQDGLVKMELIVTRENRCSDYSFEKFYPNGTLENLIERKLINDIDCKKDLITSILAGLVNIHATKVPASLSDSRNDAQNREANVPKISFFHRDIKPTNILIEKNGDSLTGCFTDFNLASPLHSVGCGTTYYRPPECIRKEIDFNRSNLSQFDKKCGGFSFVSEFGQAGDIWSLGITLLQILTETTIDTYSNQINHKLMEKIDSKFDLKNLIGNKMLDNFDNLSDNEKTIIEFLLRSYYTSKILPKINQNIEFSEKDDIVYDFLSKLNRNNFRYYPDETFLDMIFSVVTQDIIDDTINNFKEICYQKQGAITSPFDIEQCFSMIRKMLQVDPAKRISAKQALEEFQQCIIPDEPQQAPLQPPPPPKSRLNCLIS